MGNDSCRLIAQNLFTFVRNPYTTKAYFDYSAWYQAVYLGMKLMDDLVDLELDAIKRILEKIDQDPEPDYIKQVERDTWKQLYKTGERGRRTGLGITALGDTLAALGVRYSSDEALEITDQIMRSKLEAELDATIAMAYDRGPFPAFDAKLEAEWAEREDSYFAMIKREFPEHWEKMQQVGRRNISWSTIAPTGSLSMLAKINDGFGTTSGLEPLFNDQPNTCWYVRRKKINPNEKNAKVDFIDELGDRWTHFKVFHEGFTQWAKVVLPDIDLQELDESSLRQIVASSPYGGSGASEIDWTFRIKLQGVLQKYISHSISSTVNLPSDVSVETVSQLYLQSWSDGLKGITVYRDGSRSGVLVSESQAAAGQDKIVYRDAPKRPKRLPAELYQLTALGTSYTVIVGNLDGKPYEIFAVKTLALPTQISKLQGVFIIKRSRGVYDVGGYTQEGEYLVKDINQYMSSDDERSDTRNYSLMLRHGVDPKYIVQQIDKAPGVISSFNKAIARTLKRFVSMEDQSAMIMKDCPEDGQNCEIVMQEGCATCKKCGKSKCS